VAAVLVASGVGDDPPGGLYAFEGGAPTVLDNSDTTGLAVSPDGTRLARLLFTDDDPQTCGELVVYDARGVAAYRRIDDLQEPHAIVWPGEQLIAVSTLSNSILWLDDTGRVTGTRFMGGDGGDAWHMNNVLVHEGRVLASAFGRFDTHRGWNAPGARRGAGIVFDVETGADVITGLTCPHDPLFLDGRWLVCDSGTAALWAIGADGRPEERVDLGGWSRGLTYDDDHVYAGVSANRLSERTGTAEIVVLDRRTLAERRRIALPCREVFALVWVEPALLEGLRAGLAVNPEARAAGDLFATARAEGGGSSAPAPLADADCDVRLTVGGVPAAVPAGQFLSLPFTMENRGGARLSSTGAQPVLAGARWFAADGAQLPAEARARLPRTVVPGGTASGVLRVQAPRATGRYRLSVSVLQEHVRWFDGVTPDAVREADVEVTPSAWSEAAR
jgi:hypothetical protein